MSKWVNEELATAIVNCEPESLESENLKAWESLESDIIVLDSEKEFRVCDLTGLYSNCYEVKEL